MLCFFCGEEAESHVNYWGEKEDIVDGRRYHTKCIERRDQMFGVPSCKICRTPLSKETNIQGFCTKCISDKD